MSLDCSGCHHTVCAFTSALSSPCQFAFGRLVRFARYLKGTLDLGVFFPKSSPNAVKGLFRLNVYCDSDFAGDESRKSTSSKVILSDDSMILSQVKRQSLMATSTGMAEFYASADGVIESYAVNNLFSSFGFEWEWNSYTDSSAARAMTLRQGVGKVRHLYA